MNNQTRNWLNLFGQYTTEPTTWHVLSTSYSPELQIIRQHRFTRAFSTNSDRSIIYHKNTYYSPDNQTQEKSWEIKQQECNLADGVFHPVAENMRAISFGNNTSIWASKQISNHKTFGSEVFFQQEDWRYSVIPAYQSGSLERIVLIKENKQEFPSQLDEVKLTELSGKWQLTTTAIKPNLEMSVDNFPAQEIKLNSLPKDYEKYLLPEQVLLFLPKFIPEAKEFTMIVGKKMNSSCYKQIKVEYDLEGKLNNLVSEVYENVSD